MYREQGSGVQLGVDSGRYAEGPKTFSRAALDAASEARLAEAISGQGRIAPLLVERAQPHLAEHVLTVIACTAAVIPAANFAGPRWWPIVLAVLLMPLGMRLSRRFIRGRTRHADDGAYLFATDVVDVHGDAITVTPMGRATSARVDRKGARPSVVLRFEDGERAFRVRDAEAADKAITRLEDAREVLVDLTLNPDLSRANDVDPFFETRLDGAWPPPRRGVERARRGIELVLAGVLAATVGLGLFAARERARDVEAWKTARSNDTRAFYEAYLRRGGAFDAAARDRLVVLDEEAARLARRKAAEPEVAFETLEAYPGRVRDSQLVTGQIAARNKDIEKTFEDLRAREATTYPQTHLAFLAAARHLRNLGDGDIRVEFTRSGAACRGEAGAKAMSSDALTMRQIAVFQALTRALAEVVPTKLFTFVQHDLRKDVPALLQIDTRLRCANKDTAPGKPMTDFTFDVSLSVEGDRPAAFELRMPAVPPAGPNLRDRSLFELTDEASEIERAEEIATARAYDRLFDELFGLFLRGDPRVPLHR